MKYLFGLALLLLLFLGNLPAEVQACTPIPPPDYTIVTEDGNYTLVMLNTVMGESEYWVNKSIRSKYTQSGLYANNNANTLIWTVNSTDWYIFITYNKLYTFSNGKYLVSVTREPAFGLIFYENGKQLKRYKIEDLGVFVPKLPVGSCFQLINWAQDISFNEISGRFTVDTSNDEKYEFDITTGQIITTSQVMSKWKLMLILLAVIVGILLVIVGPVVFGEVRKRKVIRQHQLDLLVGSAGESINPWVIMYIKQNSPQHSRYEIDRYLLEANCNPVEIEAAWHEILIERF